MSEDSPFIIFISSYEALIASREIVVTDVKENTFEDVLMSKEHDAFHAPFRGTDEELEVEFSSDHPHSSFVVPVFEYPTRTGEIVGFMTAVLGWDTFVANLLPKGTNGVHAVLVSTCNQNFTYMINSPSAMFLGNSDLHDKSYEDMLHIVDLGPLLYNRTDPLDENNCFYSFYLYPSKETEAKYMASRPKTVTLLAALTFAVMIATFFIYERFVQHKTRKVTIATAKAGRVVSSLFSENIRDRVYNEQKVGLKPEMASPLRTTKSVREFLPVQSTVSDSAGYDFVLDSDPIVDWFPETTVLVGFTAWIADRDPIQVFILLETIYGAFDRWARRLGVFKVETIRDCYVVVTGLPEPRPDML